jgi:Activator of Hsp90 ATPase homolog 1-like protein
LYAGLGAFAETVHDSADEAGGTRYTARVRHWTVADREGHEKTGFHDGWRQSADQLAALMAKLTVHLSRKAGEVDDGPAFPLSLNLL